MKSAAERKRKERATKREAGLVYRGFWIRESWLAEIMKLLRKLGS